MNAYEDDVAVENRDWHFDAPTVHREDLDPVGNAGVPTMVRHPSDPFVLSVRDNDGDLAPRLFAAAALYLARIPVLADFDLQPQVGKSTVPFDFGWLPLAWGDPREADQTDGRGSFWVRHLDPRDGQTLRARSAVLMAGNRFIADGRVFGVAGAVGLRVVLHVGLPVQQRSRVQITGFSASQLARALRPAPGERIELDLGRLRESSLQARRAFGFADAPTITGLQFEPKGVSPARVLGQGERGPKDSRRVFSFTGRLDAGFVLHHERLIEQVTHLRTLPLDPASRGPARTIAQRRTTRPRERLDAFRQPTGVLPPANGGRIALASEFASVVPPRVGNELAPAMPTPHQVPASDPALRSDDLAAIHAYQRAQEWRQRFAAYGMSLDNYFKFAQLPLLLLPRASFRYASNGETMNAQVSPDRQAPSMFDPHDLAARPQLQVAFGCANLTHREMLPNHTGQRRAQPLGLAADPRWAWHEFGHVLNYASTGELEFRFAHSAGDAMAAIVADPRTRLDSPARMRHLTFPWAQLTRSHGRPAHLGWCWCGRRSRLRAAALGGPPPIPGGYFEEQLMSSSLFRLYCAIGGDTPGPRARRSGAADYAVYLIMSAIELLGPANTVPARSADEFVSALIDADRAAGNWQVTATWPEGSAPRALHRIGGALHKVIRWAFERQGLYATTDVHEVVEGPGQAPPVDVHIPGIGVRHDGGYTPVALNWSADTVQAWHAASDSIALRSNGTRALEVQVRNRGSQPAQAVRVDCWVCPVEAAAPFTWTPLAAAGPGLPRDISGDNVGMAAFAFEPNDANQKPLVGRHFVLAAAHCARDPANTDAATGLPCSAALARQLPHLLTDLVANDNNLGLRIVDFD